MIAKEIVEIGRRLYEKNYTIARDGNISVYKDRVVYITPTNVSKGFLKEDMISKISIEGELLNGIVPSSEFGLHLSIYRNNPDIKAVVHSHPLYVTTYACMGRGLSCSLLAEAVSFLGNLPLARYQNPGTDALGKSVLPFCKDYNGAILERHGLVTWGKDLTDAFYKTEIAELLAHITYLTENAR